MSEQQAMASAARQDNKKTSTRLAALLLAGLLVALFAFDFLSVYMPAIMGREVYPGAVYSLGVIFALGIIAAVVSAAAYYVYRLNKADEDAEGEQRT